MTPRLKCNGSAMDVTAEVENNSGDSASRGHFGDSPPQR